MRSIQQFRPRRRRSVHRLTPGDTRQTERGAALIYFIGVLLTFATIGAAMVSMFGSSLLNVASPNLIKQAEHASEAAVRYAVSQMRTGANLQDTIQAINDTGQFTLSGGGSFDLEITPTWFTSNTNATINPISSFTCDLPGGSFSTEYWDTIQTAVTADSLYITPAHTIDGITGVFLVDSATQVDSNTMSITLESGRSIYLGLNEEIFFVTIAPTTQTIAEEDDLIVGPAGILFPKKNGVISIGGCEYIYLKRDTIENSSNFLLKNVRATSNNQGRDPWPNNSDEPDTLTISTGNSDTELDTKIINGSRLIKNVQVQAFGTAGSGGSETVRELDEFTLVADNAFGSLAADISFFSDMDDFMTELDGYNKVVTSDAAITVHYDAKEIDIGGGVDNEFGAVWYTGDKYSQNSGDVASVGGCLDGQCNFFNGLRIFMTFEYEEFSRADGFTFTMMNADNNDAGSVGGHWRQGEMIGYAGTSVLSEDGTCLDGTCEGIEPPKMAVEFDNWFNPRSILDSSSLEYDESNSRWDPDVDQALDPNNNGEDTIQFVYWGDDLSALDGTGDDESHEDKMADHESFDDNAHNVPMSLFADKWTGKWPSVTSGFPSSGSPPHSRSRGDFISYEDFTADYGDTSWIDTSSDTNWFNYGYWALRFEIHRDFNGTNPNGRYDYTLKFWIRPCYDSDGVPAATCDNIKDTYYQNTRYNYEPYNHASSEYLYQEIELTPEHHAQFNKFMYGWTQATGGATQQAYFRDFEMSWIRPGDSWVRYDPDWVTAADQNATQP